ncbi:hypothetical protein [Agrobacterium rubi]|nr:hypothetical protein [Agrobacterium rubi]
MAESESHQLRYLPLVMNLDLFLQRGTNVPSSAKFRRSVFTGLVT